MKKVFSLILFVIFTCSTALAQTPIKYSISFENAIQHEAEISIEFSNLDEKPLEVRMSRTSPGRYALHEFAKNVYAVKAFDSQGNALHITRPNPHQWDVSGHDGTVRFQYTLFANRGDGTYAQVDETHAHLNIPAVFAWARNYEHRPIEITFDVRNDLNWKVATQLKHLEGNTYFAPDLYYFLDSPVEIADFYFRSAELDGQSIEMALHTHASEAEVDEYFEKVMAISKSQRDIFGELPAFDYGRYTYLNCFMPNASGDGMEHRNSTVVTSSKPADRPLGNTSIGTISHEFFHIWNVERIRPASLEPFDFEEANMSGELWFAEGFTSYYTPLTLARAGIISPEDYISSLAGALNYVINSPGRDFFNPIEMSYQAPFVDAARSVDPVNRDNTFVSYYTYGSVLGLALDLSLRREGKTLDDFYKLMWEKYGKTEIPYSNRDINATLAEYAGAAFAEEFFNNYIFDSQIPDFKTLFASVGVDFGQANPGKASLGTSVRIQDGKGLLTTNALIGSPLYNGGIRLGDQIISLGGMPLTGAEHVDEILSAHKPGDSVEVVFLRWGQEKAVEITLTEDASYKTTLNESVNRRIKEARNSWLNP